MGDSCQPTGEDFHGEEIAFDEGAHVQHDALLAKQAAQGDGEEVAPAFLKFVAEDIAHTYDGQALAEHLRDRPFGDQLADPVGRHGLGFLGFVQGLVIDRGAVHQA
ncbi:hypothetical protein D3C76_1409660 [compost metagenome]